MQNLCIQCSAPFEITKDDLAFYDKVSPVIAGKKFPVPPPTLCPDCRLQRRLCWRSETKLYHRKCDKTGKQIISMYSQNKTHPVYAQEEWWGDGWDPLSYGRDMDFSRPFFAQFQELLQTVPRPSLLTEQSENCSYCNNTTFSKNSYLCFTGFQIENCCYVYLLTRSRDIMDSLSVSDAELCSECVNCRQCYRCIRMQNAINCSECAFCFDCSGCRNCVGCVGLRQKEYHVFNKPVSKEQFSQLQESLRSWKAYETVRSTFETLKLGYPHRSSFQINSENCTGDHVYNSRNCRSCFEIEDCEDDEKESAETLVKNVCNVFKGDSNDVCTGKAGKNSL